MNLIYVHPLMAAAAQKADPSFNVASPSGRRQLQNTEAPEVPSVPPATGGATAERASSCAAATAKWRNKFVAMQQNKVY